MSRWRRANAALRRWLPAGVTEALRKLALAWGMATSRWRMQPDFIVVGAQRAGTTTLFRVLSQHPEVVRPTLSKGIGYFDLNYRRGPRWYAGHFPLAAAARRRGKAQTFESSGYYLFHPLAAERMARDLPGVKVVVLVRDPVERAYSAHRHELVRGFETLGFEEALAAEPARLAGQAELLRDDPTAESYEHRHHGYLARSRYAGQIERYREMLGPDRVHIVDADQMFVDKAELSSLFAWLGLSAWLPAELGRHNAQARTPMDPDLRKSLAERFVDDDLRLAGLMGRTPSWRRDPGADG